MKNADKIIIEDDSKRRSVLDILEILNGESYSDSKEILDLAAHFIKENSMLDYELARDVINGKVNEAGD